MINMSMSKTEPFRKDISRLVYWCNPSEFINKGKLGSTQNWMN